MYMFYKKINKNIFLGVISGFIFFLMGCESADSSNIKTKGIYAKMKAIANENGTTDISVQLTTGEHSNTVIELSNGDELSAIAGGSSKVLNKHTHFIGDITYETSFDIGIESGTEFQVLFTRTEDRSAQNSFAYLPEPFTIESPMPGEIYNSNDSVTLVWNPVSTIEKNLRVDVHSVCGDIASSRSIFISDSVGTKTYRASELIPEESQPGTNCEVNLKLQRQGRGSVDSNFDGGDFQVYQNRSVVLTIKNQ